MRLSLTAAALAFFLTGALQAADAPAPAAPKPYPLTTCMVSGEALGGMGEPVVQVYQGQEIKFCCRGCVKSFNKDPAKYMAEMDKQVAAKPAAVVPAPAVPATPAKP